jgi:predicted amino acid-binding ACT domain protein
VEGDDRAGALADVTDRLSSAKVNLTAVTGLSAGQGRCAAILWVGPRDMKKAAKIFGLR